jgi:aldehyde dehydrogenase (NAD+)/betaine-aldehyde dehydrogenase
MAAIPTAEERYVLSGEARRAIEEPACFVDGRRVEGQGETWRKLNPTTGGLLAEFAAATPSQVDTAILAARRAHDAGVWRDASPAARSQKLFELLELMENNADVLREVVVADVGSPVSLATSMQIEGALANLAWFAEAARRGPDGWYEQGMTVDDPVDRSLPGVASHGVLVREPIGVVAAITAYNFPYNLLLWKVAGALAAGCTVVLLPSPRGTLSTVALWRLLEQLELPPGVVNLVLGDAPVGHRLSTHPAVDMVSFTGSVAVGRQIMAQAASTIAKVVLELGGKSPNILLPGTDVQTAVAPSVLRLITNAGQRCGATSRILVHEDQLDELSAALRRYVEESVVVGDPREPATVVGPLIDERHLAFVRGHIERALASGATIVAGGGEPPVELAGGFFLNPVFLSGIGNDSELCREEQFGPVGAVLPYRDVDEAIAIANDSDHGLNANVFGPTAAAIRVARRLRAGSVTINGGGRIRPDAPWGGYGTSGVGRESGNEGFREFFESKHIQWPLEG